MRTTTLIPKKTQNARWLAWLLALGGLLVTVDAQAQLAIERGGIQLLNDPFGGAAKEAGQLQGAEMKTDSESQEILQQADLFVQQGRYDLASILWQRVIDESGDQVFTRDEWKETTSQNWYRRYRSVSGDIESTLAALPPEGLAAYRLKADGEARALMNAAGANDRESALAEIVRRFFLSKLGDEAAFELACLKLDRGEFLPAARLLGKIANEYPNPTVRLGEINLRLAAVNARVGDDQLARKMIGELKAQDIPPVPIAVIKMVEKDIDQISTKRNTASENGAAKWKMPHGGPRRTGLMPAPRMDVTGGLIQGWQQTYELTFPDAPEWNSIREAQAEAVEKAAPQPVADANVARLINGNSSQQQNVAPATDGEIVEKWRKNGWQPVGQVLMNEGRVYFKTQDRVACCDAETGDLQWFSFFRSAYPEDPVTQLLARYRNYGRSNQPGQKPTGQREVISFGDSLNQAMSIVGDKLVVIQGKPVDFYEDGELDEAEEPVQPGFRRFGGGDQGTSQGRARENRLNVYDIKNGKILWMLKAGELMPESKRKMAFAGSAVPYGSLLLVPVYEATSLWLFGLNPDTGELLWKSFLADEPPGQTSQNSPVRVAVDGGEAYVATGAGLVASIDAVSGSLNWAVAYPRTSPTNVGSINNNARFYGVSTVQLDGWKEDAIIPSGNTILFAPSDFNFLAALDRRTGKIVWETARTPIENEPSGEYVLGISNGIVCVAGKEVVRGYRIQGGRFLWERKLDEYSFGRGMLTPAGIYIPLESSILHLSTEDGELVSKIPVEKAENAPPVGNLYSDGEHIFATGFREVHSLRLRNDGETAPMIEKEPVSEHEKLADELLALLTEVYDQLELVTDEESANKAVQAFVNGGPELEALAKKMQALGAPDEGIKRTIAAKHDEFQSTTADKVSGAIRNVIEVGGELGDGVLVEMVGMHRKAEEYPILKEYGIDLSLGELETE